jgi:hypothetical protein
VQLFAPAAPWCKAASDRISTGSLRPLYPKLIRYTERNDQLSIVFIVQDNNFPFVRIIVANMVQYLIDELPPVLIGLIQRVKLLSLLIGNTTLLGF